MIRIELKIKTPFMPKPRTSVQYEGTMDQAQEYVANMRDAMPDAEVEAKFFDRETREDDIASGKF